MEVYIEIFFSLNYRRRWDTLAKLSTEEGKNAYKQAEEKRLAEEQKIKTQLKQRDKRHFLVARNSSKIEPLTPLSKNSISSLVLVC